MLASYKHGNTLQQIGDRYGITRERVRQILVRKFNVRGDGGGIHARGALRQQAAMAKKDAKCLALHGITYAQRKVLQELGRQMMAAGAGRERTPIGAFLRQKDSAHNRGIEWKLTLGQWWGIWTESGKWAERGRGRLGYCMSRVGDCGAYEVGNIIIITCGQNASLARFNKPTKRRAEEKMGVYLNYPNTRKPYVARFGRKSLGMFATEDEAYAARRAYLALLSDAARV